MKKTGFFRNALLNTAVVALLGTVLFSSCTKDSSTNNTTDSKANVTMRLTDAPANYDAVNVDIQKVEVTVEGSAAVTLTPVRTGIYNLLDFRNGIDTLLVQADLPVGKVSQIRLILGDNNSVVVNGQVHALKTPSAQESGLKLNLKETLTAGGSYTYWIDFDAGKSIVETGNGKYNFKPVIRAYTSLTNGKIKGVVLPQTALTTVYASDGVNTYTAIPNADGTFVFSGMPEGTYTITLDASVALFTDVTLNNIVVTYGQETNLGVTTLIQ